MNRTQKARTEHLGTPKPRLCGQFLDDPPIHIRPGSSRASGCKEKEPVGSSHYGTPIIAPSGASRYEILCEKEHESVDKRLR